MKLYTRKDFLNLPAGTIYSKWSESELMEGLFCKTSSQYEYGNDWVEQDLISEGGFPNGIVDGLEAHLFQMEQRDSHQDFETDLDCGGRDGCLDDDFKAVVWDKSDIKKLVDYLTPFV
jgi:hypothetical protein